MVVPQGISGWRYFPVDNIIKRPGNNVRGLESCLGFLSEAPISFEEGTSDNIFALIFEITKRIGLAYKVASTSIRRLARTVRKKL